MKYEIFRYHLAPIQLPLINTDFGITREQAMIKVLPSQIIFSKKNTYYAMLPLEILETFVVAQIGKRSFKKIDLKKEDQFVTEKHEEWPYRSIIFDLSGSVQKIALEVKDHSQFGIPTLILKGLAEALNSRLAEYGWRMEIEPIIDKKEFWEIVNANKGSIKSLKLVYFVPNLLGVNDSLQEELKEYKEIYGAQKVEAEIKNDDGNLIIPKTPFIEESLNHISQGGGSYSITLKDYEKKITNKENVKTINAGEIEVKLDDKKSLMELIKKIFG